MKGNRKTDGVSHKRNALLAQGVPQDAGLRQVLNISKI
jgi:hypothetical protein